MRQKKIFQALIGFVLVFFFSSPASGKVIAAVLKDGQVFKNEK